MLCTISISNLNSLFNKLKIEYSMRIKENSNIFYILYITIPSNLNSLLKCEIVMISSSSYLKIKDFLEKPTQPLLNRSK
jgi:hypothetical protein